PARGRPGGARGIGGAAALGQDLAARGRRRRVACSESRLHDSTRGKTTQPMRAKPERGKSSRWLIRTPRANPNTPPPSDRAGKLVDVRVPVTGSRSLAETIRPLTDVSTVASTSPSASGPSIPSG